MLKSLLAAVVLVMIGGLQQSTASASDNGEWSLKPASAAGTTGARTFFEHEVRPGHAVQDLARLANLTDHPITFNLYAADAYTTADGGFALRLQEAARTGVGAWVSLTTRTVTVDPESAVTFPIQIGVPADASPGDWAGGIVASVAAPADRTDGPPGLVIEQGVAARIYVRVSGPLEPALAVEGLDLDLERMSWAPVGHPAAANVSYDIANTGNKRLSGKAHLEITDTLGRTVRTFPDQKFTDLLPNEQVTFTETWPGVPLHNLRYRARVVATAEGISAESWSQGAWHVPVLVITGVIAVLVLLARKARRLRPHLADWLRQEPAKPVRSS